MINLKKINKLREGISLRDRPASQYGNLPGPRYGMDDNSSENIPYTPKTEKEKRIKAALDKMGQQFKDHPKLKEAKDPREYDYEGDMAKSQLRSIISNAQEIHDMLEDDTNIAEWVQSKITLSADYITTVRDYMNSEVNEGSVNYHTTIAQSAKGLSTKHKHSALALKSKFKPDITKYKIPANEDVDLEESKIERVKSMLKKVQSTEQKKLDKQNQKDLKRLNPPVNEEVKVGDKVTFDHPMAAIPGKTTKVTGTVHNIENDVVHIKSKDKKYGVMRYKKKANELTKIEEAVLNKDKLKTLLTRHSELAIAANKDGDHEAVKYHQNKMNDVKNQMAKLAKEEVELDESHKVGDSVIVNSKFFGKQKGKVVKVDKQSVHVQRNGKKYSEEYPHDSVMKEEVEPIHEISKELAKSYLDKTVDPVYGMPKHGMKDRMKGIRQASIRVLKKAGKPKTN